MDPLDLTLAILGGIVFGYFQIIVPFVQGEVRLSRRWPFVESVARAPAPEEGADGASPRTDGPPAGVSGRVRALLFTDLVAFLSLRLQDEGVAAELLDEFRGLLTRISARRHGRVIRAEEDEFLLSCSSAMEATRCAIEIQRAVNERNADAPPGRALQARAAVHIGEVDVRGRDRMAPAGPPGVAADGDDGERVPAPRHPCLPGLSLHHLRCRERRADPHRRGRLRQPDGKGGAGWPVRDADRDPRTVAPSLGPDAVRMFDILRGTGRTDLERIDEALGREICRQAGIDALVVASIRKFGEIYSIDLKVLDPASDAYIFTTREQGEGQESIPAMMDRLSGRTRIGLRERADGVRRTSRKVAEVTTPNLEAYQYYFDGEAAIGRLDFRGARDEFRRAISLDSTFALAYSRLAYAYGWDDERMAREPLQKALARIDRIPEKERYLVHAEEARMEAGFEAGIRVLREMEKVYPDDEEMIYNIGDWSFHAGHDHTPIESLERTPDLDPVHERALQHLAWTYAHAGRFDRMRETAERYVRINEVEGTVLLGIHDAVINDYHGAEDALQAAGDTESPFSWRDVATLRLLLGGADAGETILRERLPEFRLALRFHRFVVAWEEGDCMET